MKPYIIIEYYYLVNVDYYEKNGTDLIYREAKNIEYKSKQKILGEEFNKFLIEKLRRLNKPYMHYKYPEDIIIISIKKELIEKKINKVC